MAGAALLVAEASRQALNRAQEFPWSWEPPFTVPLFVLGFVLVLGLRGLGVRTSFSQQWCRQVIFLSLGWVSLLVALNSPIHVLGESLFWVHMVQHELLLLISAPLFVLGNIFPVVLAAFPKTISSEFGSWYHASGIYGAIHFLSRPLPAWFLGATGLWAWHTPYLFDLTLHNDWVHAAQHFTFLG
ncbi:MAG: cytochrome c oxidase assembly protein, partial [Acidobacteria bacterium]|nr:cytochrome c oxidase assembly protein [Acidobacteriota bacterium]